MPLIPRSPPNFPNPVPLWWCVWRQCTVVGYWRVPFCWEMVWDSAHTIKAEIDLFREQTRANLSISQRRSPFD